MRKRRLCRVGLTLTPLQLILTDPNILAAVFDTYAQVEGTEIEKLTAGIFSLFEYNDRLLDLMKHIITYEVERVGECRTTNSSSLHPSPSYALLSSSSLL